MKYLKMLGLAAIAALAFAAFAGATSASAAVLCKEAVNKSGECPTGGLGDYAVNTVFNAESTNSKLTVTGFSPVSSVSCTSSKVAVKNTATEGSTGVPGEVTDVTWEGCTDNNGNSCKVSTSNGYTGSLTPGTGDNGSGTLKVTGGTESTVECGGLEFFKCSYKTTESGLTFTVTAGNPASFAASSQQVTLAKAFFGCGTGADWSGTYTLKAVNSSPTALWIATKNA